MDLVDARGLGCPKPILLAEEALSKINEGIVAVLVDNEASVQNLKRFAERFGYYYDVEKSDSFWKIKLVKGYTCNISSDEKKTRKDLLIIITSDTIGKDEKLGRILMKSYFETMLAIKQFPDMIFFMNTAVKLTTTDEEFIELLKKIEEQGVEIFTCGTCLKYFALEDQLKVGYRGTTNHFTEGMSDFSKIIWIS